MIIRTDRGYINFRGIEASDLSRGTLIEVYPAVDAVLDALNRPADISDYVQTLYVAAALNIYGKNLLTHALDDDSIYINMDYVDDLDEYVRDLQVSGICHSVGSSDPRFRSGRWIRCEDRRTVKLLYAEMERLALYGITASRRLRGVHYVHANIPLLLAARFGARGIASGIILSNRVSKRVHVRLVPNVPGPKYAWIRYFMAHMLTVRGIMPRLSNVVVFDFASDAVLAALDLSAVSSILRYDSTSINIILRHLMSERVAHVYYEAGDGCVRIQYGSREASWRELASMPLYARIRDVSDMDSAPHVYVGRTAAASILKLGFYVDYDDVRGDARRAEEYRRLRLHALEYVRRRLEEEFGMREDRIYI